MNYGSRIIALTPMFVTVPHMWSILCLDTHARHKLHVSFGVCISVTVSLFVYFLFIFYIMYTFLSLHLVVAFSLCKVIAITRGDGIWKVSGHLCGNIC